MEASPKTHPVKSVGPSTERQILVIRSLSTEENPRNRLKPRSPYEDSHRLVVLGDGQRSVSKVEIEEVYRTLPKGSPIVLEGPAVIVDNQHVMKIGTVFQWLDIAMDNAAGTSGVVKDEGDSSTPQFIPVPKNLLEAKPNAILGISTTRLINFLARIGAPVVVLNSNGVDVLANTLRSPDAQKNIASIDLLLLGSAASVSANPILWASERTWQGTLLKEISNLQWNWNPALDSRLILEFLLKHSVFDVIAVHHALHSKTSISEFKAPALFDRNSLARRLHDGIVDGVPASQASQSGFGALSEQDQVWYAHSLLVARAGDSDPVPVRKLLQIPRMKDVINLDTWSGENALMRCAMTGSFEVFTELNKTTELNVNATAGILNPLQLAIRSKNLEIVKALLEHPKIDINLATETGVRAIEVAVETMNHAAIDLLLGNPKLTLAGSSALDDAMKAKDIASVTKLLARKGVDLDINAHQSLALQRAINCQFQPGVAELLKHHELKIPSECLELAVNGAPSILKVLLQDARFKISTMQGNNISMFFTTYPPAIQDLLREKYGKDSPMHLPLPATQK